jgi:hypothetical protein
MTAKPGKGLLEQEATRVGIRLAERMEDKEGRHNEGRAENLRGWGGVHASRQS